MGPTVRVAPTQKNLSPGALVPPVATIVVLGPGATDKVATMENAPVSSVTVLGRVIVNAAPQSPVTLNSAAPKSESKRVRSGLVREGVEIRGSVASGREAAQGALAAIADGSIVPQIAERRRLEGSNEALEGLRGGDALGRVVIDI